MHIPDFKEMERKLVDHGVQQEAFLLEAGINRTTWERWKRGKFQPRLSSLQRAVSAVEKLCVGSSA